MRSAVVERVKRKCFQEEHHTGSCQSKGVFVEPRKKGLELIGRRRGQDEANEAQSGEEETKTRPRRAKIGSTWGQDGAKTGPRRAKMGPRWAKSGLSWTSRGEIGQRLGRNRAEVAGNGPRWAQERPRWGQDGPR